MKKPDTSIPCALWGSWCRGPNYRVPSYVCSVRRNLLEPFGWCQVTRLPIAPAQYLSGYSLLAYRTLPILFSDRYSHSMLKLTITKEARRRLRAMPNNLERKIINKIDSLAADPFAPNNNVTSLRGIDDGFRLRVGDWRVLYTLNAEARTMTIVAILPRGDAYR